MYQRTSSVSQKGQVTIPVEIRRLLGVTAQDMVAFVVEDDEVIAVPHIRPNPQVAGDEVIQPAEHPVGEPLAGQVPDGQTFARGCSAGGINNMSEKRQKTFILEPPAKLLFEYFMVNGFKIFQNVHF